jgi:hypothetical protein
MPPTRPTDTSGRHIVGQKIVVELVDDLDGSVAEEFGARLRGGH